MNARYDVYGIGSALVDTEARIDDAFLAARGFDKGIMTLASTETIAAALADLSGRETHRSAGGSAANAMAGVAQFGGRAFFAGKSGADVSAALYRASLAEAGVAFDVAVHPDEPTGVCLALITPDGERTMLTSLGASAAISPADLDPEPVRSSAVVYIEGYLIGAPEGPDAIERVMRLAAESGRRIAVSLSDPALTAHFAKSFRRIVREYADILFCNEQEAAAYADGDDGERRLRALGEDAGGGERLLRAPGEDARGGDGERLPRALGEDMPGGDSERLLRGLGENAGDGDSERLLRALGEDAPVVFMTRGANGAMALDASGAVSVPGRAVPVVDTTGAGDAFAAGALYGLTHGMDAGDAAKLGVYASAKVVAAFGARLKEPLRHSPEAILAGADPMD